MRFACGSTVQTFREDDRLLLGSDERGRPKLPVTLNNINNRDCAPEGSILADEGYWPLDSPSLSPEDISLIGKHVFWNNGSNDKNPNPRAADGRRHMGDLMGRSKEEIFKDFPSPLSPSPSPSPSPVDDPIEGVTLSLGRNVIIVSPPGSAVHASFPNSEIPQRHNEFVPVPPTGTYNPSALHETHEPATNMVEQAAALDDVMVIERPVLISVAELSNKHQPEYIPPENTPPRTEATLQSLNEKMATSSVATKRRSRVDTSFEPALEKKLKDQYISKVPRPPRHHHPQKPDASYEEETFEQREAVTKRYHCPECSKTFTRAGDVARHQKIHSPDSGDTSTRCRFCNEELSRPDARKRHETRKACGKRRKAVRPKASA